ncbi:DNA (cytosine-5)-methyltransferase 3 like, partial [Paralvinella palmiformis]
MLLLGLTLTGQSGQLFIEFVRLVNKVEILSRDRPVFWLFENVASMTLDVKRLCPAFLEVLKKILFEFQCNPTTWDAINFSPQQRRRFFWGNIPGLY